MPTKLPSEEYGICTIKEKVDFVNQNTPGMKTVYADWTEVPCGKQVHCVVIRDGKPFASGGIVSKVDFEYVLKNSTRPTDCGHNYWRDGRALGFHIGTWGPNVYNVFVSYAQVYGWVKQTLNL